MDIKRPSAVETGDMFREFGVLMEIEGLLRAATTAGGYADRKTQQIQAAVLAAWPSGEELLIDDRGVLANWDVRLAIPSKKVAGDNPALYAFSSEALHLGFMAKQGLVKSAAEHMAVPYRRMGGANFSRSSAPGMDAYSVEIRGVDDSTIVTMLLVHSHQFEDRASVNVERIRRVLAARLS